MSVELSVVVPVFNERDNIAPLVGEIVAASINDDDARPASMNDTRMKYGGVKRHCPVLPM